MTTATEETQAPTVSTEISRADFAVFFELEYTLVNMREQVFQHLVTAMKSIRKKDLITPPEFSRYCLYPEAKYFVPNLQEAFSITDEKAATLVTQLNAKYKEYLTSDALDVNEQMKNMIEIVATTGLSVCTLSTLSETDTTALLKRVGLGDLKIEQFCCNKLDEHFPRADTWMKMARELGKSSRRCVVFASSSRACKATLSAGMRSIAVPDQFTSYQDFGGTEMILDADEKWDAQQIINDTFPIV